MDQTPSPPDQQPEDGPRSRLAPPTRVLLVSTVAAPIVIGGGTAFLDSTVAAALAVVVVLALAGVVRWAVGHTGGPGG